MVRKCSVLGCKTDSDFMGGHSLFSFPTTCPLRRKIWLNFCGRPSGWAPASNRSGHICSKHFPPSCLIVHANGGKNLKPDAVPSLEGPLVTQNIEESAEDIVRRNPKLGEEIQKQRYVQKFAPLTIKSRTRCNVCNAAVAEKQDECCVREFTWFRDKEFQAKNGICSCGDFMANRDIDFKTQRHACPEHLSTASLPEMLDFRFDENGRSVISRVGLPPKSLFGPLVAPLAMRDHLAAVNPIRSRFCIGDRKSGLLDFVLDGGSHETNWMKYVRFELDPVFANLAAFAHKNAIYFVAVKEIAVDEELVVTYGKKYASQMLLDMKSSERYDMLANIALMESKKRAIERLEQDTEADSVLSRAKPDGEWSKRARVDFTNSNHYQDSPAVGNYSRCGSPSSISFECEPNNEGGFEEPTSNDKTVAHTQSYDWRLPSYRTPILRPILPKKPGSAPDEAGKTPQQYYLVKDRNSDRSILATADTLPIYAADDSVTIVPLISARVTTESTGEPHLEDPANVEPDTSKADEDKIETSNDEPGSVEPGDARMQTPSEMESEHQDSAEVERVDSLEIPDISVSGEQMPTGIPVSEPEKPMTIPLAIEKEPHVTAELQAAAGDVNGGPVDSVSFRPDSSNQLPGKSPVVYLIIENPLGKNFLAALHGDGRVEHRPVELREPSSGDQSVCSIKRTSRATAVEENDSAVSSATSALSNACERPLSGDVTLSTDALETWTEPAVCGQPAPNVSTPIDAKEEATSMEIAEPNKKNTSKEAKLTNVMRKCRFCGESMQLPLRAEHERDCPSRPADCVGDVSRWAKRMQKRQANENRIRKCRYCKCFVGTREVQDEHEKSCSARRTPRDPDLVNPDKMSKCIYCGEQKHPVLLNNHFVKHKVDGKYPCPDASCEPKRICNTYQDIKRHWKAVHGKPAAKDIADDQPETVTEKPVEDVGDSGKKGREFFCSFCSVRRKNLRWLKNHEARCIENPNRDAEAFPCPFCELVLRSKGSLAMHKRSCRLNPNAGTDERILPVCVFCAKQMPATHLHTHYQEHLIDGVYRCPELGCSKTAKSVNIIRVHKNKKHPGKALEDDETGTRAKPRQRQCEVCALYAGATETQMKEHMRRHEQNYYTCPHCPERFLANATLLRHVRIYHSETSVLKKKIVINGKKLPGAESEYETHFFKCHDCKLGFRMQDSLVKHLDVKHPEKAKSSIPELNLPRRKSSTFRCVICNRSVLSEEQAKSHLGAENHTREALEKAVADGKKHGDAFDGFMRKKEAHVYFCEICDEDFGWARKLLQHTKREHLEYHSVLMPKSVVDSVSEEPK